MFAANCSLKTKWGGGGTTLTKSLVRKTGVQQNTTIKCIGSVVRKIMDI